MDNFQLPPRLEAEYADVIHDMVKHAFGMAGVTDEFMLTEFMTTIKEFTESPEFVEKAHKVAELFIKKMYLQNARAWKTFTQHKAESREIHRLLKKELNGPIGQLIRKQIQRNAMLITSTPLDISRILVDKIADAKYAGERADGIMEELMRLAPGVSRQRIQLIARTELAKASTALVRAQSYELGLDWYVWHSAKDGRVRPSHRKMDGVLISWNDPPDPERLNNEKSYGNYAPGEIFQCRCFAEPVIDLSYIEWPKKVYSNGVIRIMSRRTFEDRIA